MQIKRVDAKSILDSRKERTILVRVKTENGNFITSAPAGKSTGKYEIKSYKKNLNSDINEINKLKIDKLNQILDNKIKNWDEASVVLSFIEKFIGNKIGGNSLFCLEACLLKAIAAANGKELFEFLGGKKVSLRPVGNTIGGGLHSSGINGKKPDFQEFLFIGNGKTFAESVKINKIAYKLAGNMLKAKSRNDEGAWETSLDNEAVLIIMNKIKEKLLQKKLNVDIGIDIASSSFYSENYSYKNLPDKKNTKAQIDFVNYLIKEYNLFYVEDPLNENDFSGFSELKRKTSCLVVGDDLTTTNPFRLMKAIKNKSINAIIVKPNQIGSLLKVKEVIDLAKKNNIKTIISHRSGETSDFTIADLGVGFGCDFIKTGIYGAVREAKLKRIIEIEKKLR
ncbi:MAG: enolase C-terminal domain-like protein [Candidatus Pacearchaeota archaeon]